MKLFALKVTLALAVIAGVSAPLIVSVSNFTNDMNDKVNSQIQTP